MIERCLFVGLMSVFFLTACTDAFWGKVTALGDEAKVSCFSGGSLIYEGVSSGKPSSESNSDGYFFKDKVTGKFMEVSGNCVITYAE